MKTAFEGIGEVIATFEIQTAGAGKVTVGKPVKMTANGKVAACTTDGDVPVGVAVSVHGDYAAVQTGGYMKLPCATGTAVGFDHVTVDSDGKLQSDANGREAVIVDVDAGMCGVIL